MNTIRKARFIIIMLSLSIYSCSISAEMVAGLYQARVLIADRSESELTRGFSEALVKVLIKLTGQSQISSNMPWVRMLIDGAESFIERYSFELKPENQKELSLLAVFDKKILSQELQTLEIRRWNSVRPTILFRIIEPYGNLSPEYILEQDYYDIINKKATDRGLPVTFFQSQSDSFENQYEDDLKLNYLAQYPAHVEFSITSFTADKLQLNGSLFFLNKKKILNMSGNNIKALLDRMVDVTADHIASVIVLNDGGIEPQEVILEFFGIESREEFERLLKYLDALEQVGKTSVKTIEASSIELEITVKGGVRGFEQSVMYSKVLQKTSDRNSLQYTFLE